MLLSSKPGRSGEESLAAAGKGIATEGTPVHDEPIVSKTREIAAGSRTVARLSRRLVPAIAAGVLFGAALMPAVFVTPAEAAWLIADSQPASQAAVAAPAAPRVEPSSRGGDRVAAQPDISTPERFIAAVVVSAQLSQKETGVPASVTIAQAILESAWGKSGLSVKAQNYFGIKAISGPGPAGVIEMNTWEVLAGKDVIIKDAFKAYHNLSESVLDHGRFLKANPRYADAFGTTDPKEFASRMHKDGYATDPAYCDKVGFLIDRYGLAQYDRLAGE